MERAQAAIKKIVIKTLMAEPLKNQYGADVPRTIAAMVTAVHPAFNSARFVSDALDGYEALELMPRGKKIAQALRVHLPADYAQAVSILLDSLDQPHGRDPRLSLGAFLYMPHTMHVAQYGLAHFEVSMRAQYALTQRFTAEFSIRPFLEHHTQATLRQLKTWTTDPSPHVRRLVQKAHAPGCHGRRACASFKPTRPQCWRCWNCSRTTPSCTCAARWPTT
jgi:hypothetical protein